MENGVMSMANSLFRLPIRVSSRFPECMRRLLLAVFHLEYVHHKSLLATGYFSKDRQVVYEVLSHCSI